MRLREALRLKMGDEVRLKFSDKQWFVIKLFPSDDPRIKLLVRISTDSPTGVPSRGGSVSSSYNYKLIFRASGLKRL